jgi:parallel beta-helix repeat protein
MKIQNCSLIRPRIVPLVLTLAAGLCYQAAAATLCVNPKGTHGCYTTISAAVAAASDNDTIEVAAGTYHEDVVIGKPLSLVGADRNNTIVDATGLSNGFYIDGLDNSGLSHVLVRGFTIQNANFEGILVTNASFVTLWDNEVRHNDKSLQPSIPACPGIPSFETAEDFDCGEGIHLLGADHSTVARNTVENNAGGILLSDDTGATHDNLISGNIVRNNPFDCGIVLASHPPAAITGSNVPLTVVHNTIAGNLSLANGLGEHGAGAGVGIFTFVPGGTVSGNVVIHNRLIGNGLPGIAMHAHTPGEFLNDNVFVGNVIAGNGADTEDAFTPGPTGINVFGISPITGTIIAENEINHEAFQIVVNTPAVVDAHLNNLHDDTVGVDNLGSGSSNATDNWWGCPKGPGGGEECASVGGSGILFTPWLTHPFSGNKQ